MLMEVRGLVLVCGLTVLWHFLDSKDLIDSCKILVISLVSTVIIIWDIFIFRKWFVWCGKSAFLLLSSVIITSTKLMIYRVITCLSKWWSMFIVIQASAGTRKRWGLFLTISAEICLMFSFWVLLHISCDFLD